MNNKIKWIVNIIALCTVCFVSTGQAEMLKCVIKKFPEMTNYFDSNNAKERKKCVNKPISVTASNGQKISNKYKNSKNKGLVAISNAKPFNCSSTGGTVKINGRTFHLDPAALNKKYCSKGNGRISRSSRHVKLARVDSKFRRKISAHVTKMARKHGMDPAFIHAIISAESAYKPNATSHSGAMGLMQLMPMTAKRFGVTNAYNPYQNISAGTRYLRILYDEFGSLELAAAGYNAGEGSVRKYNRSIPPYKETMNYVPKVMAYYRKYKKNRSLIAVK